MKRIYFFTLSILCTPILGFNSRCLKAELFRILNSLANTENQILGKVCSIQESSSTTAACAPTPITEPGVISEPGPYCLAQDITGQIEVTADHVYIDLNGHSITNTTSNAITANSVTGLAIFNGTIIGGATTGGGISITGPSEAVRIQDVNFVNGATGLILDANNFIVDPTLFLNQATQALSVAGSAGIIQDVQIRGITGTAGVNIDSAQNILFNWVRIADSGISSAAFTGFEVSNAQALKFQECAVENNTATLFLGFDLQSTTTCLEVVDCTVNQNEASSSLSVAYVVDGDDIHMVGNNALCNTGTGFSNSGSNVFLNNKAQSNTVANFSGVGATIIVSFSTIGGGQFNATPGPFDNISITS